MSMWATAYRPTHLAAEWINKFVISLIYVYLVQDINYVRNLITSKFNQ